MSCRNEHNETGERHGSDSGIWRNTLIHRHSTNTGSALIWIVGGFMWCYILAVGVFGVEPNAGWM